MIDPSGNVGDIPYANMQAALKAGAKLGVNVIAPDGTPGTVPADRYQDAAKAGAKIVPYKDQDTQHPGFWARAADLMGGLLHPSGFSPYPGMDMEAKSQAATDSAKLNESEKAAGYSPLYRAAVPIARAAGTDVSGMEKSAKEGDVGGVAAAAAVPIATLGAAEALHQTGAGAKALDAAGNAIDAARDAVSVKGARTAIANVADTVSAILNNDATGLVSPRAVHAGRMLGKVADLVRPTEPPATNPGAPFPEVAPEQRLPAAFQPLPAKPPAVPGTVEAPFKSLTELPVPAVNQAIKELGMSAPISKLTERANNIAKLGDLLNEGLGGKGLEPNVTLKNQMAAQSSPGAEQVKTNIRSAQGLQAGGKTYVPSGGTAAELPEPQPRSTPPPRASSAIDSFHYDPEAKEMHVTWKGGASPTTYVYGEVTPEQSEMFHAAESKGMAAKSIKDNNVLVAKIVDGKRIPVTKPAIPDEYQIPPEEWNAGHEIGTQVEGSPR